MPDTLKQLDFSVVQQCIHCGLCLPACPTYEETRLERHSPRGRIALMRAVAREELPLTKTFAEEMYYCLGCLACTSACPAGVDYGTLLETARADVERQRVLARPARNLTRAFFLRVLFMRPRVMRLAGRLVRIGQASGLQRLARRSGLLRLLPASLRRLEPQTPEVRARFSHQLIKPVERPPGAAPRYRVAVLTGCVQDLVLSEVNRATVDVLLANGCEVHTPPLQPCCGSLHMHNGDPTSARTLARRLIDLCPPADYDAIISNAGGCGSHLRHYDHLLADDPAYAARAAEWSRKLRDVHEWLVAIEFRRPAGPAADRAEPLTITYHESCHLAHGQKISRAPRQILAAIPHATVRELPESTWCCGSAGIYNLLHPATAEWLQQRKVGHVRATAADVVATANPGCHLQLASGLRSSTPAGANPIHVVHPVVLLAQAYRNEPSAGGRGSGAS